MYNEIIRRFGDSQDIKVQRTTRCGVGFAIVFGNSQRYEKSIAVDDEIIHKFDESPNLTKQRSVAEALFERVSFL